MTKRIKTTFGQFIRTKRRSIEMSQQTIADALGFTHRAHVSKLEAGKVEFKLNQLFILAKLFDIPTSELIREFEEIQ